MAARLASVLPRLAVLTVIWLLATSTITFAAAGRPPVQAPAETAAPAPKEQTLVVPDVRRQAYVFAKGILDDAGFAWRVRGPVKGFAVNTVAAQEPAPGTRVLDNGSPTIVLTLARNASYDERGIPEAASPHEGTTIVVASEIEEAVPAGPAEESAKDEAPVAGKNEVPADDKAEAPAGGKGEAPADGHAGEPAKKNSDGVDDGRKPDFEVPGAPPEPKDEMPLPDRARLLERRLVAHDEPTPALAQYWLYQHAWIVAGAKFGWHDGAVALRILIRVDESVQARWGFGAKSEAIARAALAEVEARAAE